MSRKLFLTTTVSAMLVLVLLLSSRATAVTQPTTLINTKLTTAPLPEDGGAFKINEVSAETTFYPSDDATVAQGAPGTNYGSANFLEAGYDNGANLPAGFARSYIKFDLSSIEDSTIASAVFRIYQAGGQDYPGELRTISLYRVSGSWNESSLTWNNRSGYSNLLGSFSTTYNQSGWFEFDVTSLVQNWVNGSLPNYGIIMVGPENELGAFRLFIPQGYVHGPELVVRYMPAAPPVLDVWPGNLQVQVPSSNSVTTASLNVGNVTKGNLNWTAVKEGSASWLQINTANGSVTPSTPDTIPLTIDTTGLTPGIYTEQVRVSSNTPNVEDSPILATVAVEVFNYPHNVYLPVIIGGSGGTTPPSEALEVYALVVGVANYQEIPTSIDFIETPDKWPDNLLFTDDDAMGFHSEMVQAGVHSTLLINDSAYKQDIYDEAEEIMKIIHEGSGHTHSSIQTVNDIVPNTMFIFYYSGHGAQTPDLNGDEADGYDELIAPYDTLPTASGFQNVITDDELDALIDSVGAEYSVVIIDSCFSGSLASISGANDQNSLTPRVWPTTWQPEITAMESSEAQLAEVAGPNRLIITGGTGDQLTWETPILQHGVFTYFFLAGLDDALHDANSNGRISAEEAYWFTKDAVDDWIFSATNEHQNPAIFDNLHGQVDITEIP